MVLLFLVVRSESARSQGFQPFPSQGMPGPAVDESPAVANLFRNAHDAIDRSDWKLAIDSLQRIIDQPQGLRPVTGTEGFELYANPRGEALRLLTTLPEAGQEAYRILNDGRAGALLSRARSDHDLQALTTLCDRYLLTRHGQEGASLLASRLLDVGRAAEARQVLEDALTATLPDRPPPDELRLKLILALRMLGDQVGARAALDRLIRDSSDGGTDSTTLDPLEAYLDRPLGKDLTNDPAPKEWNGPGGGGPARGQMAPVVPSLAEDLPWRQAVPTDYPQLWKRALRSASFNTLPVGYAVVADGSLFAKADRECIAIDVKTFAVQWTSHRPVEGILERQRQIDPYSRGPGDAAFWDYVERSLSSSHGLVFSIEGGPPNTFFGADGVVVIQQLRTSEAEETTNRLVAYDAATGSIHWQRGQSHDSQERLRRAQFLAPPVGVGNDLWVVYEASGDLYVGVLDPADGSLRREVVLCSLGGRIANPALALYPAYADGVLYVPTGHGLLVAVDTQRYELVWASRYDSSMAPVSGRQGPTRPMLPRGWLPQPPVVSGRWVFLAPPGDDRLLAFDRLSGALAWHLPRRDHSYIIAADLERVWLGGESTSCASLAERDYAWSVSISRVTGRPALSGDTIYVPTRTNLTAIDATTGAVRDTWELPNDQPPLGNLLCLGDSMISVDPTEVRAYPDRNSYETTLAAHRADPGDVRLAIRLAFMELLNHRPGEAYRVLERIDASGPDLDDTHYQHVVHLRVEALIAMANMPDTSPDRSIAHLGEAVASARNPGDAFAARLALADRLQQLGRYQQAYMTLWELSQSAFSDLAVVTGPVTRAGRLVIGERLSRVEPELGPSEVEDLGREIKGTFDAAVDALSRPAERSHGVRTLEAMAQVGLMDGWDQAALNALGQAYLRRQKHERAEQYLLESLRHGADRRYTAEALLTLVDLYRQPPVSLLESARRAAERLLSELPDMVLDDGPVQQLAWERLKLIDAGSPVAAVAGRDGSPCALTPRLAWTLAGDAADGTGGGNGQGPVLLHVRSPQTEPLAERVLTLTSPDVLNAHSAQDGSLAWVAELRTADDFSLGLDTFIEPLRVSSPTLQTRRSLLVDGQTGLVNGSKGLHAVGLITGKRLWAVPFEGSEVSRDLAFRDATTDVQDGRVACQIGPETLCVMEVINRRELWRRDTSGHTVSDVLVRDGLVLTADPNLEEISVYRVSDGEALGRLSFLQPEVQVPVCYAEGVVCGPSHHSLIAYDARTGDKLWTLSLGGPPTGLFRPNDDLVMVGRKPGHHWLVRARTGDVLFEVDSPQLPGGALDGVAEGNTLIAMGEEDTGAGPHWTLVGLDLDTGRIKWSRQFDGIMQSSYLRMSKWVIPAIVQRPDPLADTSRGLQSARTELVLIDKTSGETVGSPLVWSGEGRSATGPSNGNLGLWPGRIVYESVKGIRAHETIPTVDRAARPPGVGGLDRS